MTDSIDPKGHWTDGGKTWIGEPVTSTKPVAWQWRKKYWSEGSKWSDWQDGRADPDIGKVIGADYEERALVPATELTNLIQRCEKAEASLKLADENYNELARKYVDEQIKRQTAERQRDELAEAVGKLGLEELAHGWHASGAYDKHPDELGVKLPSNCGTVYAIVSALRAARNAMGEPNDKT